ncbi:uncharacterized protein LOC141900064 [Tubulanus polymorphus]|uniref:uncharacterized protein LOC141900064 n=1 Tax=Tubulanus polymorphus TaxID=672921 RepID=UPI003DA3A776
MAQVVKFLLARFIRNYLWKSIFSLTLGLMIVYFLSTLGRQQQHDIYRKMQIPVVEKKILEINLQPVMNSNVALPFVYNNSLRDDLVKHVKWDDSVKIPHIIHQTWKTRAIPKFNMKWIASWAKYHPDWKYYFWTDEAAAKFVKTKFPQYYDIFMKYERPIHRADVIRYFVLYYFGGVYADIDVEAVKSLNQLTKDHYSAVSQEPWVHSRLYWNVDRLPCNAIMASSARHPFMKLLVESIPRNYYGNKLSDVMNKTGPMMVDRMLYEYERVYSRKPFNLSNTVYLAEPDVFNPSYDKTQQPRLMRICNNPEKYLSRKYDLQRCKRERENGFANIIPEEAYTNHHWMHYWVGDKVFLDIINDDDSIDIKRVIPNAVDASTLL